MPAAVLQ